MAENGMQWYAIYTRSRHEKAVDSSLQVQGVESFLPLYDVLSRWKDRRKWVRMPLFAGYLFAHLAPEDFACALGVRGVVHIVGDGGGPVPVPGVQVEAIRGMVEKPVTVSPWPHMPTGKRVRVKLGPLAGMEGFVVRRGKQCRLVISVDLLGRGVAAEIDANYLEPI
ncbi:MAG: UpxY family transcription antiterminator [Candidatus Brocadiia bacterium]|jgi:transcription antitermination factor NusG|nr:UpxY family transcription antiterminator [Candidatus Brocadiia bacterium]